MTSGPGGRARTSAWVAATSSLLILAGCGATPQGTPATGHHTAIVHDLPTSARPTTDASGQPLLRLPTDLPEVPLLGLRVRGQGYAYSVPAGWKQVHAETSPTPDSMIAPESGELPVYLAVDKPFRVGGMTQPEVVTRLRENFAGTGALHATYDRTIAGYTAQGLVIDASPTTRHVYAIVVYAERVYAIRVTYDPAREREALAVFETVLGSWAWA